MIAKGKLLLDGIRAEFDNMIMIILTLILILIVIIVLLMRLNITTFKTTYKKTISWLIVM